MSILIALVLTLTLVCSVTADAAVQRISSVQVTSTANAVQILVKASSPIAISTEQLSKFLAFDVKGHLASNQTKQVKIDSGDIGVVKCGWFESNPATARIAVSIASKRAYNIRYSDDKRQATIIVAKKGADANLNAEPAKAVAVPAPIPVAAPKVAQPVVAVKGSVETCSTDMPAADKPAPKPAKDNAKPVLVAGTQPVAVHSTAVLAAPAVNPGNRVSLDFVGTDIHDVLKALALQSNTNIVASPDVKGEVTVSLNNVTVDDALKLVTNLSGFKFQEVGDTYVVGTSDNLNSLVAGGSTAGTGADHVAEVAMIRHSDPGLLSKMLAAQFKGMEVSNPSMDDSKKGIPNGMSMLVLSGTADQVQAAKTLVAQVEDSLSANAAATQMEMYEVKYADINELAAVLASFVPGLRVTIGPNQGFNLESPQALTMGNTADGGAGGASGEKKVGAPPKILLLQGSAGDFVKARELLAKVDVQQPQIVIEAKVLDIRNDDSKDLGIEWSWNDVEHSELVKSPTKEPVGITLGKFTRWPTTIVAKVNALVEGGKARVLANPSVSALEGKPSSIFIGDEFKYVINIQQTPTGVNVTTETARVGVQLHTISRVSSDGFITMDIHPEVSVITDFIDLPQVGLSLPEISRRYVDSTIRVKDGETIVIGGLIREEDIESMSGIPILRDLPLIGSLFRNRSVSKQRSEIMMFITPRVLTNNP